MAGRMREHELEAALRGLLAELRLYGYHTADSRRSQAGFPDWVIIGVGGVLWRELKTETGRLSSAQLRVSWLLRAAGQDYAVWRPSDLQAGRISAELAGLIRRTI